MAKAAQTVARSAAVSGALKAYVEMYVRPDGRPDLRLREKVTRRTIRVLTTDPTFGYISPLANLLRDCYEHGGGLIEPRSRREYVAILAPIFRQDAQEVAVRLDSRLSVRVNIQTSNLVSPPASVWCYIEEYAGENGSLGLRLRQKETGRKVEMYGQSADHLARFLAGPRLTSSRDLMPNLYEKEGFRDYVLVSGGTTVDTYDLLLFEDGAELTYLFGPSPDTAYRDAFRVLRDESPSASHARTATTHFESGRYREAVLSARLAVEMACGGSGHHVKRRLFGSPDDVSDAGEVLYSKRNSAVHEGGTRVEQPDAREAIGAMKVILDYISTRDD